MSDSAGKTEQSVQSYHFAWLSHWTNKSHDLAVRNPICSSNSIGKGELDHGNKEYQSMTKLETASNSYRPVKGREKMGNGTSEVSNDSFGMTSAAIRGKNPAFPGFSTDVHWQNGERTSALNDSQETFNCETKRPQIKHNLEQVEPTLPLRRGFFPSMLPTAPDANDTSSRGCRSQPDDISQNIKEPVKTLALFRDDGFDMPSPWPVDFTASTSRAGQHEFDHGVDRKNLLSSYMDTPLSASKGQVQQTNLRFPKPNYQRHSAILGCEDKMQSQSKPEQLESSCSRQERGPLLQTNLSTRNNHLPTFGGELFENVQNFSAFKLFPDQSKLPEVTKSQELHHDYSSVPKFLCSIRDVETMRIHTTVDSLVGVHGGHPRFSQTTHSMLITKKTDFKENQTFRSSRAFADHNAISDLHNLAPPFGDGKRGLKLKLLGGSKDVEESVENVKASSRPTEAKEEDVSSVKDFGNYNMAGKGKEVVHDIVFDANLKNESSSETGVMELDEFEDKGQVSGVNYFPLNKALTPGYLAPLFNLTSKTEVGDGPRNGKLPVMNYKLPTLPTAGKPLDNGEPSTSRTQSLDMETLVANAEQLSHSELEHCLGGSAKQEPSCAWVKRLKLNASNSFVGTSRSNLGPSREKNNFVLARTLEGTIANPEPIVNRSNGKELMVPEKSTPLSRRVESFFSGSSTDTDSLLSHSWIQRWRHSQATTPEKKPEPLVVCEPQSSKLDLEDLQKKQFPSIAAMALMGKAMNGFQPCQLQKKGSFVVWN